ncbi:MAG: non-canonical purine NTP pyrophosphatase [Gemmatimonadota bacterium]|nr:non-canonical purine NTP pyrophosphatase [Gemmatimonadota bacterium]
MHGLPVVLATHNAGKLRELRPLFAAFGIQAIDLGEAGVAPTADDDAVECYDTFEENAIAKARHFHARTGLAVFSDDSGLEIAALDGRPGVRSKRWSERVDLSGAALDAANNATLVSALAHVADRRARYVCIAAFVNAETERAERGEIEGEILDAPRGTGGFGYDPYFFSRELGVTFGQASISEKEFVSHRGRAFRALLSSLGPMSERVEPR